MIVYDYISKDPSILVKVVINIFAKKSEEIAQNAKSKIHEAIYVPSN